VQSVTTLEQLDQASNSLAKKAREWYAIYWPELERESRDHEAFLSLALSRERVAGSPSMGGALAEQDVEAIREYLRTIARLYEERKRLESYLAAVMSRHAPNVAELAGPVFGARLLAHAGSLRRLATVPSSTIQLFGAETALFRHLRDKRKHRAPKYGVLFNHPLVQRVAQSDRGRAARSLADKLSLCAKLDYFKGERKAPQYRAELSAKFTEW
jgi:nucleolar protein 56